jgi:hypothetical protein
MIVEITQAKLKAKCRSGLHEVDSEDSYIQEGQDCLRIKMATSGGVVVSLFCKTCSKDILNNIVNLISDNPDWL